MKANDRPLSEEERAQMEQGIAAGLERIGVSDLASPDVIQQAIKAAIDKIHDGFTTLSEDDAGDAIWGLATLWADAVTRGTDWTWIIFLDGDEEIHAIASPNRSHIIYPFHYIHGLLSDPEC